ncbi:YetF domain-containing protein [Tepidibacter aestuarii]|uniref:YetF domain-containing protein n=1 Tax=Tepidibacter aestuarii TaxID=2925782 RepID=UPI0020C1417C|nr:YetF domain-containing protein [Tepidibacter aestuarii]
MILFEVAEYYFKGFEKLLGGKEKVIFNYGVINEKNMKKLKLTNDELYSRLRQKGINKIEDVKKAILEPNG